MPQRGAGNLRTRGKGVAILGSTGSIGKATIEVLQRLKGYRVVGLAARSDIDALERQARSLKPRCVAVHDRVAAGRLKKRLGGRVRVLSGPEGVVEVAASPAADIVVSAMVGSAGLEPTYEAVRLGKRVALANKETLVIAGEIMARAQRKSGAELLPVDSEHSAIFQCLQGESPVGVRKIILTGSGGPFRKRKSVVGVTVRQALAHPTWRMGRKITIDSATMMNKGLEIIEARWLFGVPVASIEVLIHPQSIVHSMVEFVDGSVMAQMGMPDMKLPIQYSLTWPERAAETHFSLDLARVGSLTFEPPDLERFPSLKHARAAAEAGGCRPVVLNAANEVAVEAFLHGKIPFPDIAAIIGRALGSLPSRKIEGVKDVVEMDREARAFTAGVIGLVSR